MKTPQERALSIRLPETLYQSIRKKAFDAETSIAKIVRKALEEKFNNKESSNAIT